MNGWIKISRSLLNHWIWQDAVRLKWWLDLLMMAAWEDKEWYDDGHTFTLRRGQTVASIGYLVMRWKCSKPTVIKFLKMLEREKMIKRVTLYRRTPLLTICNYDNYQSLVDTQADTQADMQADTLVDTNKEYKENKEVKKNKKNRQRKDCEYFEKDIRNGDFSDDEASVDSVSEAPAKGDLSDFERQFEAFRQLYPGSKRGLKVEFANLRKKYPQKWREIVPQLVPAVGRLLAYRRAVTEANGRGARIFLPNLANLSTWISNARWQDEFPGIPQPLIAQSFVNQPVIPVNNYVASSVYRPDNGRQQRQEEFARYIFNKLSTPDAARPDISGCY